MAGEMLYQVMAKEAGVIKKYPAKVKELGEDDRGSFDLAGMGYPIAAALELIRRETGAEELDVMVAGFKDIGHCESPVGYLMAKQVKVVAKALAAVNQDEFKQALMESLYDCDEDLAEKCFGVFKELRDFLADAAEKGKAVVKTIY